MARAFIGHQTFKGRGTSSNPAGRFESAVREAVDDGWYREEVVDSPNEIVQPDKARTVITSNDSPDVGFDNSINPYRGCSHGCVYCFARPSHGYLGLSPGLDFETRLFYKADAAKLLQGELARPGYVCKPIALGINTDAYQPLEKRLQITRGILSVLEQSRHPVTIVTKSALILRDLDLLTGLAKDQLLSVAVSVTSLDAELKRTLEPRTASPQARLRVIRELTASGIPVTVLVAPVIPAITDHELESILEAAREAGAVGAGYVLLRLPYELKDLFREWLANHYPDRAQHVMSLIRQSRGGRDNDPNFGSRMKGTGPYAELLRRRFELASRRLGFRAAGERQNLSTCLFRAPVASPQLTLGF